MSAAEQVDTLPSLTSTNIPVLRATSRMTPGGNESTFAQWRAPGGQTPPGLKWGGSTYGESSMNPSPFPFPPEVSMFAPPSTPSLTIPSPPPNSVSGAFPAPDPPSTKRIATVPPLMGRVQESDPRPW
jgi:hypothetical protein